MNRLMDYVVAVDPLSVVDPASEEMATMVVAEGWMMAAVLGWACAVAAYTPHLLTVEATGRRN